uniref:HTH dtxR-type domain-containing protein n=1 Tax=Dictyoglomus thermophilum TaxID=14 RepID=A0A7C3RKA9_DICTH
MSLTKRRIQFLETLRSLYKTYNRPIHYEEVAQRLSVSPATAYDILQTLSKDGYIDMVYLKDFQNSKKGRGKVFFLPKEIKDGIQQNINKENNNLEKYSKPLLIVISFITLLLSEIKLSKELKSFLAFLLSNYQSNWELILLVIPFLLMSYTKNLYKLIPESSVKKSIDDYITSINQLASEEKKLLVNFIFGLLQD